MTFTIRISGIAERDIGSAAAWYAQRSGTWSIADKWVDGLHRAISGLAENPERFGVARETVQFDYDLREMLYGSGRPKTHRVLFRVENDTVHIMAVRHSAQRDVTPEDL
jgi:plasmid stabilization system protein ParE